MYPSVHALRSPDKPAYIMAESGETVSYLQLDRRSNQGAQLFSKLGLVPGDHIALCMENNARFFEICWAAQRSGLYFTAISSRLTENEIEYILDDCQAQVFITSEAKRDTAIALAHRCPGLKARYMVGGTESGYESWEDTTAEEPSSPIPEEFEGRPMLYSSGTTGKPKGVKHPLPGIKAGEDPTQTLLITKAYGATEDSVYLSPAPLYHAAPLIFTMNFLRLGATCVIMENFDALRSLTLIEQYGVTHSQWVPTMFVRMLKLPEQDRNRPDLSSLEVAIHAAAPCPIPIKEKMIEWWGPVIHEYYAGTEGNGFVMINSEEWLAHKGSVGQATNATIHILDDDGLEVEAEETGGIFFESDIQYEYHNAPEKTASARSQQGWTTLGDVGYLDKEGWLYLTDRKAHMIISGGVNIYPQEAENRLITHPRVQDVAVIGVPNEDFGEEVKAVVQLIKGEQANTQLAQELMEYCRSELADIKCPRSVDFLDELPRHPTGKLYKRLLKDKYWKDMPS
ncbi:MAG: acyl-CoA synthetase [Deltaproteobacteria bacterium]|nr:acyl-CoA synthetase [Deltaproteobacteria bacterium]